MRSACHSRCSCQGISGETTKVSFEDSDVSLSQLSNRLKSVLKPCLRKYQLSAVKWMMSREGLNQQNLVSSHALLPTWSELDLPDIDMVLSHEVQSSLALQARRTSRKVYFNALTGTVIAPSAPVEETVPGRSQAFDRSSIHNDLKPAARCNPPAFVKLSNLRSLPCKGGILADEMGLGIHAFFYEHQLYIAFSTVGKSLEVLSLIMCHPFVHNGTTAVVANPSAPSCASELSEELPRGEPDDVVACYCGSAPKLASEPFVQCDACRTWQHWCCVGFSQEENDLNLTYFCPNCTDIGLEGTVSYDCSSSTKHLKMLDIKATLIVCPPAILAQWQQEIERHSYPGALQVVIFEGSKRELESMQSLRSVERNTVTTKIVRPIQLAKYDIVLTTYSTLRTELYHVTSQSSLVRNRKQPAKYRFLPTPLTGVRWWRICLDEAQMMGEGTARCAEMALKLQTVNRWNISGTPIPKGLDDLFGLLLFLSHQPWNHKAWWRRVAHQGYCSGRNDAVARLHDEVHTFMWRTLKVDVEKELGVPPQTTRIVRLKFSAIERFNYNKRFQDLKSKRIQLFKAQSLTKAAGASLTNSMHVLQSSSSAEPEAHVVEEDEKLAELVDDEAFLETASIVNAETLRQRSAPKAIAACLSGGRLQGIFTALLQLRQSCCHHQVGYGTGLVSLAKSTLSLEALTRELANKAKVECEEKQRRIVLSLLALAGLCLLRSEVLRTSNHDSKALLNPSEISELALMEEMKAISFYRQVLTPGNVGPATLRIDKLQRIHAATNLVQILSRRTSHGTFDEYHVVEPAPVSDPRANELQALQTYRDALCRAYLGRALTALAAAVLQQSSAREAVDTVLKTLGMYVAPETRIILENGCDKSAIESDKQSRRGSRNGPESDKWWDLMLSELMDRSDASVERRLVSFIQGELDKAEGFEQRRENMDPSVVISGRFHSVNGLKLMLWRALQTTLSKREIIVSALDRLAPDPTPTQVLQAASCVQCKTNPRGAGVCPHCQLRTNFSHYEACLFRVHTRALGYLYLGDQPTDGKANNETSRAQLDRLRGEQEAGELLSSRGREADLEIVFKALANFYRREFRLSAWGAEKQAEIAPESVSERDARDRSLLKAAAAQLELFQKLVKEYAACEDLRRAQHQRLSALDELNMCVMRLQLRGTHESVAKAEESYVVRPHELAEKAHFFETERISSQAELERALGQWRYLCGLVPSATKVDELAEGKREVDPTSDEAKSSPLNKALDAFLRAQQQNYLESKAHELANDLDSESSEGSILGRGLIADKEVDCPVHLFIMNMIALFRVMCCRSIFKFFLFCCSFCWCMIYYFCK